AYNAPLVRDSTLATAVMPDAEGWIRDTATTVKIFIDLFIGVWSFVLAVIWCSKIEKRVGEKIRPMEIWERFPKFVLGYFLTFLTLLLLCLQAPARLEAAKSLTA